MSTVARKLAGTTRIAGLLLATALVLPPIISAHAETDQAMVVTTDRAGLIITPGSSLPHKNGTVHTNTHGFVRFGKPMAASAPSGTFETPASLACIYGVVPATAGCNPATVTAVAKGGSRVIAIVDAYDYPTAASDLAVFSQHYGLPAPTSANFQVVYATGVKPAVDSTGGWAVESALDIQMAHSLAPNAKIILVEAASSSLNDMLNAEMTAASLVSAAGGGEISNSWAMPEFASETAFQVYFGLSKTVAFASAGDKAGTGFPAVLQGVVAVGGTTINRDSNGNYLGQSSWGSDGGGLSTYVARPAAQNGVSAVVGTKRGAPDLALVANPSSGVWVYDTTPYSGTVLQWSVWGGTSVAAPLAAAMANAAGNFAATATVELTKIYAGMGNASMFTDITSGTCGNVANGKVSVGYDLCTGVGAPTSLSGM